MPRPMGTYDPAAVYDILDLVSYNNSLWICKVANTVGVEPTTEATDTWQLAVNSDVSDAVTLNGLPSTAFAQADGSITQKSMGTRGFIVYPDGGVHISESGSVTGRLRITLPVTWNNTMLRFVVDVYDFTTGNIATYYIGGYAYENSQTWHYPDAYSTGKARETGATCNLPVHFAHDGEKCVVAIGNDDTKWSYPKVIIRELMVAHKSNDYNTWRTGWSISFTTDNSDLVLTKTVDDPWIGSEVEHAKTADNADHATTADDADTLDGKSAEEFLKQAETLSTDILELALTLENGVHEFVLNGSSYPEGVLPQNAYRYGNATVYKRGDTSIAVALWGTTDSSSKPLLPYFNYYNANGWTGWQTFLPTTGGWLSSTSASILTLANKNAKNALFGFYGSGALMGHIGIQENIPVFVDTNNAYKQLLHTGNSAPVTVVASATEGASTSLANGTIVFSKG